MWKTQSTLLEVFVPQFEKRRTRLREEYRRRVFENIALKRIFGPKRNGVTGEW
jgi:hypothetical protein